MSFCDPRPGDTIRRELSEFDPQIDVVREAHEALDALITEARRLRRALEEIDFFIGSLAYPGPETNWIHATVRVALAAQEAV